MRRAQQSGLAVVEFAVIAGAAMTLLLICVEVGRMLFVWNTLGEATRRGARVAAVSAIGSGTAKDSVMVFAPFLKDFDDANVNVSYLGEDGANLGAAPPAGSVAFVNVTITGYVHELLVPPLFLLSLDTTIEVPAFSTTLPAESLGIDPEAP